MSQHPCHSHVPNNVHMRSVKGVRFMGRFPSNSFSAMAGIDTVTMGPFLYFFSSLVTRRLQQRRPLSVRTTAMPF